MLPLPGSEKAEAVLLPGEEAEDPVPRQAGEQAAAQVPLPGGEHPPAPAPTARLCGHAHYHQKAFQEEN